MTDWNQLAAERRRRFLSNILILLSLENASKKVRKTRTPRKKFSLTALDDETCQKRFWFRKKDIQRLPEILKLPNPIKFGRGFKVDRVEAVCILLRRLSSPSSLEHLAGIFFRSKSTISRIFNYMVEYIYEHYKDHMKFHPSRYPQLRLQILADAMDSKFLTLSDCIGFIDYSVRPICKPTVYGKQDHNKQEHQHGLKYQSIVTPDGLIADLSGPWDGTTDDATILKESELVDRLSQLGSSHYEDKFVVYTDSAYEGNEYVIAPFRGESLTEKQECLNKDICTIRENVECEFDKVIGIWKFLDSSVNHKILLQPVGKYYIVGAFLTNLRTCLYGNATSNYFLLDPPTIEEYVG